ncbi:hypothetical protein D3C77_553590 [compost metagenome]
MPDKLSDRFQYAAADTTIAPVNPISQPILGIGTGAKLHCAAAKNPASVCQFKLVPASYRPDSFRRPGEDQVPFTQSISLRDKINNFLQ